MTFLIASFHVRLPYTWLIGFGLITWSLAANYFHDTQADLPVSYQWASGAIATLLILVSVFCMNWPMPSPPGDSGTPSRPSNCTFSEVGQF